MTSLIIVQPTPHSKQTAFGDIAVKAGDDVTVKARSGITMVRTFGLKDFQGKSLTSFIVVLPLVLAQLGIILGHYEVGPETITVHMTNLSDSDVEIHENDDLLILKGFSQVQFRQSEPCLLYTSPSPRD